MKSSRLDGRGLAFGLWLALGLGLTAAGAPAGEHVTAYLVLEREPVISLHTRHRLEVGLAAATRTAQRHGAQLQAQQAALAQTLDPYGARVIGGLSRVANALKVRAPAAQLEALAALPGVARVQLAQRHQRSLARAVPFLGAARVWEPLARSATGAGIRMGIVDSGIDYHHAMFGGSGRAEDFAANDPTRLEPGTFPTAKVVGGWDFVGDRYNASSDADAWPRPDPDPLDCAEIGHGTHVAGMAAGLGVQADGTTYRGPYTAELDPSRLSLGPGVAPEAVLYAVKVFGCTGSTDAVTEALEWAADPNGDFDFSDRLDVVNLSLGSGFGHVIFDSVEIGALDRLAELGCFVTVAAGNDGNSFFISGSPGAARRALTVANSTHLAEGPAIEATAPAALAGRYFAVEGAITQPLAISGPVEAGLVYVEPNLACGTLLNAGALRGRVALVDRGTCFFTDKVRRVQDAGALAVVMVNNQPGAPIVMGGDSAGIRIPGVMISQGDGALFKAELSRSLPVTVRLAADLRTTRVEFLDTLADSSSRGPSSGGYLKPDLSAPGTSIVSAQAGSGSRGVDFSGTSMSSALAAGAAALLRQVHPTRSVADLKAALMNSAKPLVDPHGQPYPESRAGAGRLQVADAVDLRVTASGAAAPELVAVSFGSLVLAAPSIESRGIRLTNHSATAVTYEVAVSNTVAQDGVSFTVATNRVIVPGHEAVTFDLRLAAVPALFAHSLDPTTPSMQGTGTLYPRHALYEASGQVWFRAMDHELRVPFYAQVRAASEFRARDGSVTLPAALSGRRTVPVSLTLTGQTAHAQPVVSAFQLGALSPDLKFSDPYRAAADLLAVGVASDVAVARTIPNTTLYFGVATAGSWATPQRELIAIDVEIDTTFDGRADFVVYNANTTVTNLANSHDVLISVVESLAPSGAVSSQDGGGYLNILSADQGDTAPFYNSVLVLPAPARLLGLLPEQPRFRYRAVTYDPSPFSGRIDHTAWIPYDAARPVVDTAAAGLPLFDDGEAVSVRLDRSAAADAGLRRVSVLLFHHHNLEGQRVDVVPIDLGDDDTDFDTLPDWWEQSYFGTLEVAGRETDSDGDGASDRLEFLAGTHPRDPAALLRVRSVRWVAGLGLAVRWASELGKTYIVERATDLALGFDARVVTEIYATPPTNEIVDSTASQDRTYFYRVRLGAP
ncbi:MAG: hypothetical protein FJ387_19075 [Verrucomicrobia bacterium]|nr:hypothetical protein [Verrucomicrobiota bacterium]